MLCLCREPTSKTLHVVSGTYSGAFNVQQRKPGVLLESRKSGHQILSRLFFFFFFFENSNISFGKELSRATKSLSIL